MAPRCIFSLAFRSALPHSCSMSGQGRSVQIPIRELECALLAAALEGFHGSVRFAFFLPPELARHVRFTVERNRTIRPEQKVTAAQVGFRAAAIDSVERDCRQRRVREMLSAAVGDRLSLRLDVFAVTGHFADGMLEKVNVEDGA